MTFRNAPVIVVAALLLGCGSPPVSVRSAGSCQVTEVPGTSTERDVLTNVAPVGGAILAAGTRFPSAASIGLAALGSGGSWSVTPLPKYPGTSAEMADVAGTSARAWIVGAVENSAPAIARWDGHAWFSAPVADPGPQEDGLAGVTLASDRLAWAVGRHEVGGTFRTLIERWNGTAWQQVSSPNDHGSGQLNDVAATGPDDAWAVGWTLERRVYRPLMEHWNGAGWSVLPTPTLPAGDALLSGVTASSPKDAWAVGWTSRADQIDPVVEHWDGHSWSLVALPSGLGHVALSAVAVSPGGIVAVGRRVTDGNSDPAVLQRGSAGWVDVPVATAHPNHGSLTGVAIDASGTLWAVGTQFSRSGLVSSLVVSGCAQP